jgi:site-specific DNA recombinase
MEAKKVGIWVRVSTEMQVDSESPAVHEERARTYAKYKQWEVAAVYKLDGVSGKSTFELPETKRMLDDVKSGRISGLIFSKLARFGRNTRELLDFADIFDKHGADLISLAESIDTSTPAGRLFYTVIAALAQWEREEISSRVAASVPIRAKMGKPTGGAATFGYKWVGNELIVDEAEAPVRKLMYELFLKHKRKKTTAEELNKRGHRTRGGSLFSDTTIDRLLKDPTAKGTRIANYTKSLGEGKKWVIKPKEEWVVIPCPAIVSEDLWNQCNAILIEQETKRKPGPRPVHLLSGFVYCTCGKKMYVYHEHTNTYRCKGCKTKITATDLDDIYYSQLKDFLCTNTSMAEYFAESTILIQEKEQLLKNVTQEAAKIKKRMDELVNMRIEGDLSKDAFSTHYKPLEEQYNQLEKQLPELAAEVDFLKIQQLSSDTILDDAKNLYARWPELPLEEKRSIAEIITEKITVGKTDISLSLAYLPTPLHQNAGKRQHNLMGSWKPGA